MFKSKDKKHLKSPTKPATTCRRLNTPSGVSFDPSEIASEFRNYFLKLALSKLDSNQSRDRLSHLLALSDAYHLTQIRSLKTPLM